MATDNKYDRQLRLWGPSGQKLLNESHVLLINCEPVGVELMKNLVLPGIGHISILDDHKITERDLGNNFFVDEDHLNKNRAEVVCSFLLEMNSDVEGKSFIECPWALLEEGKENFLKKFTLIIVNEMPQNFALKMNDFCQKHAIHFIYLYTIGLIGYIRIFGNNHTVIESKPPDTSIEDLRISEPFPELKAFADSFDMEALDDMEHGHVPYVIILMKVLEEWKRKHDGLTPQTFQEKTDLKNLIKSFSRNFSLQENFQEASKNYYKCFKQNSELPGGIEKIFSSKFCEGANKNSTSFWILCKALKDFYTENHSLPLLGKIPDMTSLTSFYVKLQNIYKEKAESDVQKMLVFVHKITDSIKFEEVKTFCENCWTLEWIHYRSLSQEYSDPLALEFYENTVYKWYLAVRGCQIYEEKHHDFPKLKDREELEKIVNEEIIKTKFPGILPLEKEIIEEISRYEGARLHNIAAMIGGVGAQESIKLLTSQFVPFNHTFIFNGINCEGATFEV